MSRQSKLRFAARLRRIKERLRDEGDQIFGCQREPLTETEKWYMKELFSRALPLLVWEKLGKGARKCGVSKVTTFRRYQIDE